MLAYGHYYLQVSHQAIEPLGECKSNVDFFRELALRMGFEDDCFRETIDDLIDIALSADVPQLKGITRERLERDPNVRLNLNAEAGAWLPFANGFATPNGKARIYDADLIAEGMDPVASFVAPEESRHHANAQAVSAGAAGAQGRQLSELDLRQSALTSEDGTASARTGNSL